VEDDPRDAELALKALAASDPRPEVIHLQDGADALDFLYCRGAFAEVDCDRPVVMLLDLKMPRVDGLEVLRQVKSDPALKTIPVVMLTSSREEQDVLETYSIGANAYIVKPLRFRSFQDAIQAVGAFWTVLNEPPPAGSRQSAGDPAE
jgi:CheY-like chemotaxis protein